MLKNKRKQIKIRYKVFTIIVLSVILFSWLQLIQTKATPQHNYVDELTVSYPSLQSTVQLGHVYISQPDAVYAIAMNRYGTPVLNTFWAQPQSNAVGQFFSQTTHNVVTSLTTSMGIWNPAYLYVNGTLMNSAQSYSTYTGHMYANFYTVCNDNFSYLTKVNFTDPTPGLIGHFVAPMFTFQSFSSYSNSSTFANSTYITGYDQPVVLMKSEHGVTGNKVPNQILYIACALDFSQFLSYDFTYQAATKYTALQTVWGTTSTFDNTTSTVQAINAGNNAANSPTLGIGLRINIMNTNPQSMLMSFGISHNSEAEAINRAVSNINKDVDTIIVQKKAEWNNYLCNEIPQVIPFDRAYYDAWATIRTDTISASLMTELMTHNYYGDYSKYGPIIATKDKYEWARYPWNQYHYANGLSLGGDALKALAENLLSGTSNTSNLITQMRVQGAASLIIYEATGDIEWLRHMYNLIDPQSSTLLAPYQKSDGSVIGYGGDIGFYTLYGSEASLQANFRPLITNCYLYQDYVAMTKIAGILGNSSGATFWQNKANLLAETIRTKFWNTTDECFYSLYANNDNQAVYITIETVLPIAFGIATQAQANTMINRYVMNASEFWNPFGLGTLPRSNPDYVAVDATSAQWQQGYIWHWQMPFELAKNMMNYNTTAGLQLIDTMLTHVSGVNNLYQEPLYCEYYDANGNIPVAAPAKNHCSTAATVGIKLYMQYLGVNFESNRVHIRPLFTSGNVTISNLVWQGKTYDITINANDDYYIYADTHIATSPPSASNGSSVNGSGGSGSSSSNTPSPNTPSPSPSLRIDFEINEKPMYKQFFWDIMVITLIASAVLLVVKSVMLLRKHSEV
jgi:hypothetical protein